MLQIFSQRLLTPIKVGDEAIHKELGDRMERVATTASSLEAEQDSVTSIGPNLWQHLMSQVLRELVQKLEGSEGFHQIIDFLTASHIKYALTENPTIYVSLIEQFWQIATISTLEDKDMSITAIIDGKVKREGSTIPVESHHTPTSIPSTSQPPTSSPSMPTTHVAEEDAPMPHDSPLPRVHSLGSDEGSLTLNELTVKMLEHKVKSIKARRKVRLVILDDEDDLEDPFKQGRKIAQIDENEGITLVQMGAQTQGRSDEDLITTKAIPKEVSTVKPDMDVTLAEALVDLLKSGKKKSPKPKVRGISFQDPEEVARREVISPPVSKISAKDKGKAIMTKPDKPLKKKDQIQSNEELALRLHAKEQAEFERLQKERAVQEEASRAAIYEEMDNIQATIEADEQLSARVKAEEQELYSIEEKSRLLVEMITERKRFFASQRAEEQRSKPPTKSQMRNRISDDKEKGSEKKAGGSRKKTLAKKKAGEKQSKESSKRQKMEDDAEKEELRAHLDIILGDDVAIFTEMLDDFDRQDVLDLYRLVKERFETASPEGYNRLLWGDLITVFEPSKDDEVWKAQQDYTLISWRLFDSCGVHVLLMDIGIAIHMLVEKAYPLTQEMLSRMLSGKLEVNNESEMAFELLRFTRSHIEK
ncbi:hypothetical protein Tco_1218476 [Tanacetum coccineum]